MTKSVATKALSTDSIHSLALIGWLNRLTAGLAGPEPEQSGVFAIFIRADPDKRKYKFLRSWLAERCPNAEMLSADEVRATLDPGKVHDAAKGLDLDALGTLAHKARSAASELSKGETAFSKLIAEHTVASAPAAKPAKKAATPKASSTKVTPVATAEGSAEPVAAE